MAERRRPREAGRTRVSRSPLRSMTVYKGERGHAAESARHAEAAQGALQKTLDYYKRFLATAGRRSDGARRTWHRLLPRRPDRRKNSIRPKRASPITSRPEQLQERLLASRPTIRSGSTRSATHTTPRQSPFKKGKRLDRGSQIARKGPRDSPAIGRTGSARRRLLASARQQRDEHWFGRSGIEPDGRGPQKRALEQPRRQISQETSCRRRRHDQIQDSILAMGLRPGNSGIEVERRQSRADYFREAS